MKPMGIPAWNLLGFMGGLETAGSSMSGKAFIDQFSALDGVTKDTVRQFIADHVGTQQFIQVAVLPR